LLDLELALKQEEGTYIQDYALLSPSQLNLHRRGLALDLTFELLLVDRETK